MSAVSEDVAMHGALHSPVSLCSRTAAACLYALLAALAIASSPACAPHRPTQHRDTLSAQRAFSWCTVVLCAMRCGLVFVPSELGQSSPGVAVSLEALPEAAAVLAALLFTATAASADHPLSPLSPSSQHMRMSSSPMSSSSSPDNYLIARLRGSSNDSYRELTPLQQERHHRRRARCIAVAVLLCCMALVLLMLCVLPLALQPRDYASGHKAVLLGTICCAFLCSSLVAANAALVPALKYKRGSVGCSALVSLAKCLSAAVCYALWLAFDFDVQSSPELVWYASWFAYLMASEIVPLGVAIAWNAVRERGLWLASPTAAAPPIINTIQHS